MSIDLRKAQKHMHRATELINQSQLGFGKDMKKSRESYKFGGLDDMNVKTKQNMMDHMTCTQIRNTSEVNRDLQYVAGLKHLRWCKEKKNMKADEILTILGDENAPVYMRDYAERQMYNYKSKAKLFDYESGNHCVIEFEIDGIQKDEGEYLIVAKIQGITEYIDEEPVIPNPPHYEKFIDLTVFIYEPLRNKTWAMITTTQDQPLLGKIRWYLDESYESLLALAKENETALT